MRILLSILLWGALACTILNAQNSKIDSLKIEWKNANQVDSIRFEKGFDLYMLQFRQNLDTARATGQELLQLALAKKNKDWEATALNLIGRSHAVLGEFTDALKYFQQSHEINIHLNDTKATATSYNNIGTVFYELGNYTKALENMLAGLKISEELEDKPSLARVTNNLGNVYVDQKNNLRALEYYTRSLEIKKELGNKRSLPAAFNNIGLVYTNLENHELALENLLKSAEIAGEIKDKRSFSRAYSNIGAEYSQQGDYKMALQYLNESVRIKEEINDREGLPSVYSFRAKTYLSQKNYRATIKDADRALALSKITGALGVQHDSYKTLSSAWEGLNNMQKSLEYYKLGIAMKDSLVNQEKIEEITRQELQYEFEKQQLADSIAFNQQKADQALAFEKNLSKQRTTLYFIIFGILGLLGGGLFYWNTKQKNKKLAQERSVIARLKQVDALKDEFLANTSHELRTPLNGIIGLSESLKDGVAGALPNKALENLDMIATSGRRLSHLVNDILDFSKLKNQDINLSITPVDIGSVAEVVLKLSEPLAADRKIKLINSVSKKMPLVNADENRLQQILFNLVGNAIKFTSKGSVTLISEKKDDIVLISVIDTGIGIAEDKLDSIFNSFEQGDGSTERQYGGTGLGLSVTKQLVSLHGGSIEVSSQIGKGSIFSFSLPISKNQQEIRTEETKNIVQNLITRPSANETKANEMIVSELVSGGKNIHILIVDDEPINRRVLQNHLTIAGYTITETSSGKEALTLLESESSFDLILLDIMMPGMSGYEVCERIRKKYGANELPIVLLTAKNAVSELVQGFTSGANDYLTKPFSKNELLSRIKTHVNLNGIHKATSKFVPTEFIKSVGKDSITDVVLGDYIEKDVTVLFTDVRDYTHLAETMTPQQNFKFVNAYVGRMGPIIQQNKGFVNQYLGDGIMALFPHEAEHALDAAIEMQRTLALYNQRRIGKGYVPIAVGMGLHTGPLVMGIIGDEQRNDPAIIADTVNTASRTEGVTKHYGVNIIISGDSLSTIDNKDDFNFRYLGKVKVKGKEKNIGIYECFDGDDSDSIALKIETLEDYKKGLSYFSSNQFAKASVAFEKVLDKNPKDSVAKYFITKSAEYTLSGIPKDGEIVNTMREK